MLVLAPAACCLAGLALHQLLLTLTRSLHAQARAGAAADPPTPAKEAAPRKPSKAGKVRHCMLQLSICVHRQAVDMLRPLTEDSDTATHLTCADTCATLQTSKLTQQAHVAVTVLQQTPPVE